MSTASKKPKAEHLVLCNRYFEQTASEYWNINDFVKHCRGNNHGKLRGIGTIHNYWWNSIKNRARDGTLKERQRANEILAARKKKTNQNAAAAMLINGPTTIGTVHIVSQAPELGGASASASSLAGPSSILGASAASAPPPPPSEISGYEPSELGLTDAGTEPPFHEDEGEVAAENVEDTSGEGESTKASQESFETPLDREFRLVREKFAVSELPDLFYHSIIDVSDPLTVARFQQTHFLCICLHFPPLPAPPESFEYAVNRFISIPESSKTPIEYRKLVESCPRRPGVEYSQETHVATYVNHCVQTMLCTPRGWMNAAHREGTFDVCVWGPFIDFLFLATPDVTFARKELSALIATNRDRFDGVLRYDDRVIAFDVGIHECSIEAVNVANDAKREGDFIKVTTGLADMLQSLAARLDHRWELMQKVEVVGILTTGWNITLYRLAFLTPQLFKLTKTRTRRLSFDIDKLSSSAFAIMRILVQHKLILERTLKVILEYEESRG